ncbi:hypothetical protein FACS189437_02060 [Bacteroidia bacterium]|nr:hypothetical protein FACS189437_02060 [Bacteroidia bacterium]
MGQSLAQVYLHLVFSTKNRYPFIHKEINGRKLYSQPERTSSKIEFSRGGIEIS